MPLNKEDAKRYYAKRMKDPEYRERAYAANRKYALKIKRWIVGQLKEKCSRCGFSENIAALEVHHKTSGEIRGYSHENNYTDFRKKEYRAWFKEKKLPKDIVLLCSNCHRIEHHPIT